MTASEAIRTAVSALHPRRAPRMPSLALARDLACVQEWDRRSTPRTSSTCFLAGGWVLVVRVFFFFAYPAGFGAGGPMFTFGGPGFRTQYYRAGGARTRPAQGQRQGNNNNQTGLWFQLLPILILVAFSLLSYLPTLFSTPDPDFRWRPTTLHRAHRTTFERGVSYYVDPVSFARHPFVTSTQTSTRKGSTMQRFSKDKSSPELLGFEKRVEDAWMKELYRQCENAQEYKRRRLLDAQGFFGFGVRFHLLLTYRATRPKLPRSRQRCTRAASSSHASTTFVSRPYVGVVWRLHVTKNLGHRGFCFGDDAW